MMLRARGAAGALLRLAGAGVGVQRGGGRPPLARPAFARGFLDFRKTGNKEAMEKEKEKKKARLTDEMSRGYFADIAEIRKNAGKIAMASKVIIPEADAVKFPDLAVDSPAGGALHLPLVAPALQDDGGEAGDHVIPSASLVCPSFLASSCSSSQRPEIPQSPIPHAAAPPSPPIQSSPITKSHPPGGSIHPLHQIPAAIPAMECEPEELQFLGVLGIYRFSAEILGGQHRPLFARIAAAFVLPLSALFLLHIAISHALFTHIDSDDTALDASSPGTDTQRRLLSRLASDWLALLLFKSAYLLALLLLSLLSVAASVFSVASVYSAKRDALTFPRVLSVVPRVWRRLAATFLAAFALLFAYHAVAVLVFVALLVAADNGSSLAGLVAFLVAVAYIVGLVYLSVVWHLASVVSVLEDFKGFAAMRKSKDLIKGKLVTAGVIFFTLNLVFAVVELGFRAWVVKGSGVGSRLLLGLLMLVALCCVVMFALVTQTVVYLVCKSYHHESLDKANISDHLEVYLGDYVPLKASDVQMEQFQV